MLVPNEGKALGIDHVMISGGTTYYGKGYYDEVEACLKTQPHGVFCIDQGGEKSQANVTEDQAPTLATTHGGEPAVLAFDAYNGVESECNGTLRARAAHNTESNNLVRVKQ